MQQHTTFSRSPNAQSAPIPDFVIAAALKGIQRALREMVHDQLPQAKPALSRLLAEVNHE
jgi:hypothetical protein